MYIKIKDGVVEKYPYYEANLRADNPNTSFPAIITDTLFNEFNVFAVKPAERPEVDYTKNVIEQTPKLINGEWCQNYEIVDATEDEIAQRILDLNKKAQSKRLAAYQNESDTIFFKWQRGEATKDEWLNKIEEIKLRFPYI